MDINKLIGIIPNGVIAQIPQVIEKFSINTPLRLAHFLSQCAHESGEFTRTSENLNYSDINRIIQIFRSDVDLDHDKVVEPNEIENAKKYVKNPKAMANFVYANQNGNGNEASGDGYNFRGRGYIQLTGKGNYIAFDNYVENDIINNPNLVAIKYPLLSAAWYWNSRKINTTADKGINAVSAVTKLVNGGQIGLDDRILKFNKYYKILNS